MIYTAKRGWCQLVDKEILKNCIPKIREVTTVKIWARQRQFNYGTVLNFLHGSNGKRQVGVSREILKALIEDGFIEVSDSEKAA